MKAWRFTTTIEVHAETEQDARQYLNDLPAGSFDEDSPHVFILDITAGAPIEPRAAWTPCIMCDEEA